MRFHFKKKAIYTEKSRFKSQILNNYNLTKILSLDLVTDTKFFELGLFCQLTL